MGTKCATVSESNICVSYNLTDYERITKQQKSKSKTLCNHELKGGR